MTECLSLGSVKGDYFTGKSCMSPIPSPLGIEAGVPSQECIQLRWLTRIRWAALACLAVIFVGADYLLELGLYTGIIAEILVVGCLSNAFLMWLNRHPPQHPDLLAGLSLVFDVLLLTGLLFVSGGYTNPFSMVYLAYVALAALVLDARWTWGVFFVSLACFFLLFFLHIPLPPLNAPSHNTHHGGSTGFSIHLHGMLVAFVCIGAIVAAFVTRMNREMSEQASEISELRRLEEERRRLVALATLTAGVTHELATPLATLSLIGDDLAAELKSDPRWRDDVAVLRNELDRCAAILQRMRSSNAELQGELPRLFSLREVLEELRAEFANVEVSVLFEPDDGLDVKICSLRHALIGSLKAIIRNAVQACVNGGKVVCRTEVQSDTLVFSIQDTGVGMTDEVRARIGEPFFTSKAPGQGMGLGFYLTKLFALQVGGAVRLTSALGYGSEVVLTIPRVVQV